MILGMRYPRCGNAWPASSPCRSSASPSGTGPVSTSASPWWTALSSSPATTRGTALLVSFFCQPANLSTENFTDQYVMQCSWRRRAWSAWRSSRRISCAASTTPSRISFPAAAASAECISMSSNRRTAGQTVATRATKF